MYLTLFFAPARKPERIERAFIVLYQVIVERWCRLTLGTVERNVE